MRIEILQSPWFCGNHHLSFSVTLINIQLESTQVRSKTARSGFLAGVGLSVHGSFCGPVSMETAGLAS
jgi:hypothetical protein